MASRRVELVWQVASAPRRAARCNSISLGPGEEVKLAVATGAGASRRTRASARSRSSRRWSARARSATDGCDAARPVRRVRPAQPRRDTREAARRAHRADVRGLRRRAYGHHGVRRRQRLGGGTTLRTLRTCGRRGSPIISSSRSSATRVIVRTAALVRPALLVPFRLPRHRTARVWCNASGTPSGATCMDATRR